MNTPFKDWPPKEQLNYINKFPTLPHAGLGTVISSIKAKDYATAGMTLAGNISASATETIKKLSMSAGEYARSATYGAQGERIVGTSLTTALKNTAKIEGRIALGALKVGAYAGGTVAMGVGAVALANRFATATGVGLGVAKAAHASMEMNYANPGMTNPNRVHEHKYNMGASGDMVFAMHNSR